jgi:murein DD-endopeptidase MepM/ murein hydrolase activator NlpD
MRSRLVGAVIVMLALVQPLAPGASRHGTANAQSTGNADAANRPYGELPEFKLPYSKDEKVYWTGGPHAYNLSDRAGKYPSGQGSGLDFANGSNFEVLAMAGGVVEDASCGNPGFGCQVAIRHDVGGTVLIYAHLLEGSTTVTEGKHVLQGDVLGKAGRSGGQGATHLHIELRDGSVNCYDRCLPGGLGGNPIGWDDLVPFVDGYSIGGYLADSEGLESYNYDGSAVKGDVVVLYEFPYLDQPGNIPRKAIVRVHSSFQCSSSTDCELNTSPLTQFAGNGTFGGGRLPIRQSDTARDGSWGGRLISTNVPRSPASQPAPCVARAEFQHVESFPDDMVVQPGQSMDKWWRVKNSGTCDWSGYQLMFESGEQMGAPSSVVVPSTPTGGTVDIHVPMVAPTTDGKHASYWRIVTPSGAWVDEGPLWIRIQVEPGSPPSTSDIELAGLLYPTVVAPGQSFRPLVTVRVNQGRLLESRGDMLRNTDGNLFGAWPHVAVAGSVGTGQEYTFQFYENDPITAPQAEGTYITRWRVWRDGNWAGPEIQIRFDVRIGGGTQPSSPAPQSPADWYVSRDGSTPSLCASAPGSLQFYFEIYESQTTPQSGWISSDCWTPPTVGPYTYQWHVKVRDPGSGLESDWSETWHFSIDSQQLTIDALEFQPGSPSDAEEVRVYTCVHGFGGIGLGLKIEANTATDCSAAGEWQWIHHLGTFCYDHGNPGTWPNWGTRVQPDGNHLIRATGYHDGDTIVTEACYQLSYRRPPDVEIVSPLNGTWWDSRDIAFAWKPALRTDNYHLLVSTNPDPAQTPILDVYLDGTTTEYAHTFEQDHQTLYWKIVASNSKGEGQAGPVQFGIDRNPPSSAVDTLPAVNYEPNLVVNWQGFDDRSGVRWYDVQYRDGDRGEWTDWVAGANTTVGMFHSALGHVYCFRSRAMDTAGNWESYPTGNGDTCTTVDVTAAPPTAWWDTNYASKRNIVILNNDAAALPASYPIHLHFDSTTSPTSAELYASSLSPTKGDDFRVVYNNATERERWIGSFNAGNIDIWFRSGVQIPGLSSDESSHQLYYGSASASTPPGTINDVIPEPNDGNTVGLWHFQEGSGSTVSDSSGNGHHGAAASMAWTDGKFGAAGVFDGTNTHVDLGTSTAFNMSNITLEAWIKLTSQSWSPEWTILRKDSNDGSLIYDFLIQEERVYLRLNGNSGFVRSNSTLQTNKWYHVAGTYDGSTIRVYINGTLDSSASYNTPLRYGSSTALYLGWNGRDTSAHFPGHIQNVRVSNIARTSFPYAAFAYISSEPSVAAGAAQAPPASGSPDLVLQSLNAYPAGSGLEGGVIVQAVLSNEGDRPTENGFFTDLYSDHLPSGPGDYSGSLGFWVDNPIEAGSTVTLTTLLAGTQTGLAAAMLEGSITESSTTLYGQTDSAGSVTEPDDQNNISQGVEVCVASDDLYEPDNSPAEAQPILGLQTHNINTLTDEDWVSFSAEAGQTYALATSNLGLGADTYLYLYDTDAATLLAANDDYGGTLASRIVWECRATGTYYAAVKHWNPNVSGCGTTYDLSFGEQHAVLLPLAFKRAEMGSASVASAAPAVPTTTPTPVELVTVAPNLTPTATDTATAFPEPTITATVPVTNTATLTPTPSPTGDQEPAPEPTSKPTPTPIEVAVPTPTELPTPTTAGEEEPRA